MEKGGMEVLCAQNPVVQPLAFLPESSVIKSGRSPDSS